MQDIVPNTVDLGIVGESKSLAIRSSLKTMTCPRPNGDLGLDGLVHTCFGYRIYRGEQVVLKGQLFYFSQTVSTGGKESDTGCQWVLSSVSRRTTPLLDAPVDLA